MSGRVVHFEIPFDDGDRARAFYKDAFGWNIMAMPELSYTMVSTGPVSDQGMPSEPGYINGGMFERDAPVGSPVITLEVEDIDSAVFVSLYDVGREDKAGLDEWEIDLYRRVRVRVQTLEGEQLAWLYVLDTHEGGLPSASYLGIISEAAVAAGAPDDYVHQLRHRPCSSVSG